MNETGTVKVVREEEWQKTTAINITTQANLTVTSFSRPAAKDFTSRDI